MTKASKLKSNGINLQSIKGTLGEAFKPFFKHLAKKGIGTEKLNILKRHWEIVEMYFGVNKKLAEILSIANKASCEKKRPRTIDKMANILHLLFEFCKDLISKQGAPTHPRNIPRKETLGEVSSVFFQYLAEKGFSIPAHTSLKKSWRLIEMYFGADRKMEAIYQSLINLAERGFRRLRKPRTIDKMTEILRIFLDFCHETGRVTWSSSMRVEKFKQKTGNIPWKVKPLAA